MRHLRTRHQYPASMLASAAIHMGLLLFMALAMASSTRTHLAALRVSWSEPEAEQPRTVRLEQADVRIEEQEQAAHEEVMLQTAPLAVRDVEVPEPELIDSARSPADSRLAVAELDLSASVVPAVSDAPVADRFAASRRGGGAAPRGAGPGGETSGARGTFFGHPIPAGRIVFVLDCSGSMNASSGVPKKNGSDGAKQEPEQGERDRKPRGRHPSRPGYLTRWDRLVEELTAALQSLDGRVEFTIILFSEGFVELEGGMRVADSGSREQAIRWIEGAETGHNTYPFPALQRALRHSPDVIYFLTDGDFDAAVINQITWINGRLEEPATIHTIGLGDLRGRIRLTNLARRNGGEFLVGR